MDRASEYNLESHFSSWITPLSTTQWRLENERCQISILGYAESELNPMADGPWSSLDHDGIFPIAVN